MNRLKNFLLLFLLLASLTPASHAQNVTTQGTEFWVSFMTNITYPLGFPEAQWLHTEVLICAKRDCQGIIKNPNTGWLQRFTVEADSIFVIDLPRNQAYFEEYQYEQIRDKGVIITTTDTVSVYCANNVHGSFDASYVLPT